MSLHKLTKTTLHGLPAMLVTRHGAWLGYVVRRDQCEVIRPKLPWAYVRIDADPTEKPLFDFTTRRDAVAALAKETETLYIEHLAATMQQMRKG
jgi:hypothetical protein